MELNELKECNSDLMFELEVLKKENKKLKEKINKSIEYTNRFINGKTSRIDDFRNVELVLENIVEILKGDSDE